MLFQTKNIIIMLSFDSTNINTINQVNNIYNNFYYNIEFKILIYSIC